MHLTQLKVRILDYLHHLSNYDYIAYGWLAATLFGFLLLAIALAGKKPKLSLFMILIVLLFMMTGPLGMKYALDQTVRKVVLVDKNVTELPFSKNLVILGTIKNKGRVNMHGCRVFVDILKKDDNKYKQILYQLKPLRKKIITLNKKLDKGEEMAYKIVLDHFAMHNNYLVRQSVECY